MKGKRERYIEEREKKSTHRQKFHNIYLYILESVFNCFLYWADITFLKMKTNVMAMHQYPVFAGKQDILREVVMKYIDHFYPK